MPDDLQYLPPDKVCSRSACLAWSLIFFQGMFFSKVFGLVSRKTHFAAWFYCLPQERERDADIRKMLLEALLQLCATRKIRKMLRQRKAYPILRELHKWEPEEDVRESCEQVVDVLLQEEGELADNLGVLDVPKSVASALEDVRVSRIQVWVALTRLVRPSVRVTHHVLSLFKSRVARGEGPELEFVPSKADMQAEKEAGAAAARAAGDEAAATSEQAGAAATEVTGEEAGAATEEAGDEAAAATKEAEREAAPALEGDDVPPALTEG